MEDYEATRAADTRQQQLRLCAVNVLGELKYLRIVLGELKYGYYYSTRCTVTGSIAVCQWPAPCGLPPTLEACRQPYDIYK